MKQIAIISLGIALAAQALINIRICHQRDAAIELAKGWAEVSKKWQSASDGFEKCAKSNEQECMKAQAIARECIELAKSRQ